MNYLEIPCSCSDCMKNPKHGTILKARFKVGDKVSITQSAWKEYATHNANKLNYSVNTIQEIREVDGMLHYSAFGLKDFLDDELELV